MGFQTTSMFLRKEKSVVTTKATKNYHNKLKYKHTTFFKFKTPKLRNEQLMTQEHELGVFFKDLMTHVWHINSSAALIIWDKPNSNNPIKNTSVMPNSREACQDYTDRIWLLHGKNCWI